MSDAESEHPKSVLAVVFLVMFLVSLDLSIVNVALPDIATALNFSPSGLSWVVNAFMLPYSGLMLLGGRLSDLTGRRRLLLSGLLLFAVASALGGAAQDSWQLIVCRALQGVAAAVLAPMSLALVTAQFPEGPARSKAMAVWGGAGAAGGAFGVVMSGLLTDNLSWRWVMWVNLLFVAAATYFVLRGIRASTPVRRGPVDVLGALAATVGMSALVAGVISTSTHPWGSGTVLGWFAAGFVALAVFVWAELRAADPLVPLGFLRRRSLVGATVFGFMLVSGQLASFYFVSQMMQRVLGYSPTQTGLAFLPFCFVMVVGLKLAQVTMAHFGSRTVLVASGILGALGLLWFGQASADSGFLSAVLGPSIVCSIGIGAAMVAMGVAGVAGVSSDESGLVSGILNSSRTLGGSLGLAVLVTVAGHLTGDSPGRTDLANGFTAALMIAAGLLVVGSVAAALILPRRDATTDADADATDSVIAS